MNWLAHTLLSKNNTEYQLGNLLADPMKGRPWTDASAHLRQGMLMHKAIDRFTDGHALLSVSKARLGTDGHLKGVVLDLLFDHFLSIRWSSYGAVDLPSYLQRFHDRSVQLAGTFPAKPQRIINRLAETELLAQYQTFAGFVMALQRIDQRLSARARQRETASQYLPVVEQQHDALLADFDAFFPQLVNHFKQHQLGSKTEHWLV
ncbi:ACP phosphodiesterase [Marinicella meishanensis]|uniref:acyl carrier protein phosphodiesterase n=1 Tax=Marinicella meishanensis TaxID=2873263 RepID=UPI001CC183E1|nr:ACP phosphodiesterase [Marinicella sp. NBU2979]